MTRLGNAYREEQLALKNVWAGNPPDLVPRMVSGGTPG